MPSGTDLTSSTPTINGADRRNSTDGNASNGSSFTRTLSNDPTEYVQRTRVTKPVPVKPACDPLQFIKVKPCILSVTAQKQIKRAEEVKKIKEVIKEEPEDWQNNLDSWKSCRRKRVEHIIERVVENKKLELEEHDRTRRKSKTFNEMLEERGGARRKVSLAVYTEDDSNDLSDLGIGTSSASGKSSLSEDFDNHSVISDNQDTEKSHSDIDNNSNHENGNRDYVSSPGYDTSSSTAPASSPDPCEYTYEGAIQDYKSRVSRAQFNGNFSKDSTPERFGNGIENHFIPKRPSICKIEDKLLNFELKASSSSENLLDNPVKKDLPKVNISKRRELFEKENSPQETNNNVANRLSGDFSKSKSIKDRLFSLEQKKDETNSVNKKINRLSGDVSGIKERFTILNTKTDMEKTTKVEVPITSLKDRLTSLHSAVSAASEEVKKPIILVDLNALAAEEQNRLDNVEALRINQLLLRPELEIDTDREDSGIQTADVSCAVSQADEQPEEDQEIIQESKIIQLENVVQKLNKEVVIIPDVVPFVEEIVEVKTHVVVEALQVAEEEEDEDNVFSSELTEQDTSVLEALEIAFDAIDCEPTENNVDLTELLTENTMETNKIIEPIYENLEEITEAEEKLIEEEPHYQVPKSPSEPYYEVPKPKPVPLYENVDIFYSANNIKYPLTVEDPPVYAGNQTQMEPPKEKPPPPPVDDLTDDEEEDDEEIIPQDAMKRINSTRRIKKDIRNKRSSFLGIEGTIDDERYLELSVAPPPDMAKLLKEQRIIYQKAGLCDSSDTGESRDSGVSENHSRQSSEPFTNSSEEQDDYIAKKEQEIIEVLEKEERRRSNETEMKNNQTEEWLNGKENNPVELEEIRIRSIEDQIKEQEDLLRFERDLLQLEQEELKRQRENLLHRENLARKELDHGTKMMMSGNRRSLNDINDSNSHYANVPNPYQIYQVQTDYRKSMSDLQAFQDLKKIPPTPPVKPLRSQIHMELQSNSRDATIKCSRTPSADVNVEIVHTRNHSAPIRTIQHSLSTDEFVQLRQQSQNGSSPNVQYGNLSRQSLHALSAVPKPKFTDGWVQQRKSEPVKDVLYQNQNSWIPKKTVDSAFLRKSGSREILSDARLSNQQKRKSDGFNYNTHWLIQEAEQRRIEQQRGIRPLTNGFQNGWNGGRRESSDNKPLPDSIIQTLTQRVQNKKIGERKLFDTNLIMGSQETIVPHMNLSLESQEKILSVSGKKKCSHCGDELGRGAAMIIESLCLFYHIECFKCCVCHVQLGDGLNGTDVRVRNQKLHCHNCYSSDDGVKFSCV